MHSKQTSRLALGTAILALMVLSGCGGNGTVNPTGNISNFQAINQGNPNVNRVITVVPSANQVTSLVSNGTNLNTIVTTGGSTITTLGAQSLTGFNGFPLVTGNSQSEVFAVNSGSVTPIQVNADGTMVVGTSTSANNIEAFTGGQASAMDSDSIYVAATIGNENVLDTFSWDPANPNNAPTQSSFSDPLPAPLTSLTANVGLQANGQFGDDGNNSQAFDLFGADGTNTQMFEDDLTIGTPVSVDGAGTDLIVTDTLFQSQGGNTPNIVVAAAGPQTVAQTQGGLVFGINVGSAFAVTTGNAAATLIPAGSAFIPLAGATAATVPTSACFVFGNSVNGSNAQNPAFLVIGTNTPTCSLVIIPVNQQVNQQNGFLNLGNNNQLITQFDGQGVIGLNAPQTALSGNGSTLSNGFNTQNIFVGVTGSGPGTAENAFGAAVNPLSNPSLLFGNLVGNFNVDLGLEAASGNGNPVTFISSIFP